MGIKALVDRFLKPVRKPELIKPQARPSLTGVRHAFAPTIATGLDPFKLAGILRASAEGDLYEYLVLAEEMEERDPHYASVLGVRKRAVSGVKPIVTAASEDKRDIEIAKAVEDNITNHDGFTDLVEDMLDALGKGFSVIEIDWQQTAKSWHPNAFIYRDPRFFTYDRETSEEIRLLDESAPDTGLALEPYKFICHRSKVKSGIAIRGGLARLVAFGHMCKSYTVKDWMSFIETYGLPLRLGKYGPSANDDDIEMLFQAVTNIGTDAAAVMPENMNIEFQEITGGAGNDIFENLARWVDEQTSKAVLGQTMTSDNGSSRAQANVHNEVRHDIATSDARAVKGSLNRDLVKPYVDLNFGVQDKYPIIDIPIVEPEDLDLIMQNVDRMAVHGVRFRQSEIRKRLGFDDPDDDDEVIGGQQAIAENRSIALNRQQQPHDPYADIDDLEAVLNGDWQEVIADTLTPIEAVIASANSYEEAIEGLAATIPDMRENGLIDRIVKAAFKARAHGDADD